jgi:hypothetical protein
MAEQETVPTSMTFASFLRPGIDRCAFIEDWLRARDVPHSTIELAGKRHIVVRPPADACDPRFRMKTLVAHYDRAADTPGANDNSAACFQLMLFAERLAARRQAAHNVRIIFTDGEEAAGTKGIAGQGAFALGEGLRKLKMTGDDVFVLDACGRGDTLVLSTAGMEPRGERKLAERISGLHERAITLVREAAGERWARLPTPYSDNAGFLAAGIASQVITVLPASEAEALLRATAGANDEFLRAIAANTALPASSPYRAAIPDTWKLMHSASDSAATLTASAFTLMGKFLEAAAKYREAVD